MKRNIVRGLLAVGALFAAGAARAADTDFSTIVAAVGFSGVVTAILAIAAVLVVPRVASRGAKMVLSMVGK